MLKGQISVKVTTKIFRRKDFVAICMWAKNFAVTTLDLAFAIPLIIELKILDKEGTTTT